MPETAIDTMPAAEVRKAYKREKQTKKRNAAKKRQEAKEEETILGDVVGDYAGASFAAMFLERFELTEGVTASWLGIAGSAALVLSPEVRKDPGLRFIAHAGHGMALGKTFEAIKENNPLKMLEEAFDGL